MNGATVTIIICHFQIQWFLKSLMIKRQHVLFLQIVIVIMIKIHDQSIMHIYIRPVF